MNQSTITQASRGRSLLPGAALLAVFMALTTTLTTLADSLFLAAYPVESLPGYLVVLHLTGIVVTLALLASNKNHHNPLRFFFVHLCFALLAFNATVWAGAVSALTTAVLCVVVHTAASMTNLSVWAQAMGHVHTHSAKSQVPFLAAGLTVGGMISGAFVVFASSSFTVNRLLLLFVVLLMLATLLTFLLERVLIDATPEGTREYTVTQMHVPAQGKAIKDPLVRFLAVVSFLFAIGSTFLDFQYKSILQSQPNAERIAFYLGGLHFVLNFLVLTGQVTFSKVMAEQTRIHRIFPYYPRLVLLAVFSALFLPVLLGAFFARVTERTFRYLILNASTDIFMGPMRSHFKTRAVWLTKGVAYPLGTIVSILIIMGLFQFVPPGDPFQVNLLYIFTIFSFGGALFFSKRVEGTYRAFLASSLGVGALAKNEGRFELPPRERTVAKTQSAVSISGVAMDEAQLRLLFEQTHPLDRRKGLFRLKGTLSDESIQYLLARLEQEREASVLSLALRLMCRLSPPFTMPVALVEHESADVRFFARYLLTGEPPVVEESGAVDLPQALRMLELSRFADVSKETWQNVLCTQVDNAGHSEEILAGLFAGTPWSTRGASAQMPQWRHLVELYRYFQKNPLGVVARMEDPGELFEERLQSLLEGKAHLGRLWLAYQIAFCYDHERVMAATYKWGACLQEDDSDYLLPLMEHPDPFVRCRVLSLLYLLQLEHPDVVYDDTNLFDAIQRTSLDCMIGAGILAELQQKMIRREADSSDPKTQGFALLLNAQLNETTNLFFGVYGLMVGPIWAKRLYQRFVRGSQMTQADVVEYCRSQAEAKIIEPMMLVLGSFHPDKTLSNLRENLPRIKTSFSDYALRHTRLRWYLDWFQMSPKEQGRVGDALRVLGENERFKNLPPQLLFDLAKEAKGVGNARMRRSYGLSVQGIGLLVAPNGALAAKPAELERALEQPTSEQAFWWPREVLVALLGADNRLKTAIGLRG